MAHICFGFVIPYKTLGPLTRLVPPSKSLCVLDPWGFLKGNLRSSLVGGCYLGRPFGQRSLCGHLLGLFLFSLHFQAPLEACP